jgi:hypothetical protein
MHCIATPVADALLLQLTISHIEEIKMDLIFGSIRDLDHVRSLWSARVPQLTRTGYGPGNQTPVTLWEPAMNSAVYISCLIECYRVKLFY